MASVTKGGSRRSAFDYTWPAARLGDALLTLAQRTGLASRASSEPLSVAADVGSKDVRAVDRWLRQAADTLGIEAQLVSAPYAEIDQLAMRCAPAVLRIKAETASDFRYLVVVRNEGRRIVVVTPDLAEHVLPASSIREARFAAFETRVDANLREVLGAFGVRVGTNEGKTIRLRAEFNPGASLTTCWTFRATPGSSWASAARRDGLFRAAAKLFAVQLALSTAAVLAWTVLGAGALSGRSDRGWLIAWGLLVVSEVPLLVHGEWLQGFMSLHLGKHFKQRLLWGAGHLDADAVRAEGSGAMLARVFEAEAVESLALDNGFQLFGIAANVVLVPLVLASGAGGLRHVVAFIVALFVMAGLGVAYVRARARWTDGRLGLTSDLVERMLGHRTRIAQQTRARWHDGEDERLASYVAAAKPMDLLRAALVHAPRAWIAVALVLLAPAMLAGASTPALAASIGGALLGLMTLQQIATATLGLSGAHVALRSVLPLLRAGRALGHEKRTSTSLSPVAPASAGDVVLDASDVAFRYAGRANPVLAGCSLRIHAGERVLIEGPSGGGKTTFASLLSGLRTPSSGLLLLRGVDRATLGDRGWRERVVLVPQFHENHVFAGSLSFNLLLGRRWPAEPADLADAEELCRELGLGDLLDRMPRGLGEVVGDAGWQLSHGERSRVFIARALLQNADVVILDESFGALDPGSLEIAMECAKARAKTLVVIAHP